MAREVRHDDGGPYTLTEADVDPEHGDIAVCRCGLSAEFPFCDGSHRAAQDEVDGMTYLYADRETDWRADPEGEGVGGRRAVAAVRTAPENGAGSGAEATGSSTDAPAGRKDTADTVGARVVTHEARGPLIVDPGDLADAGGSIDICRCGLGDDGVFCDGSHRATANEVPGAVYRYGDGERRLFEGFEFVDGGAGGIDDA